MPPLALQSSGPAACLKRTKRRLSWLHGSAGPTTWQQERRQHWCAAELALQVPGRGPRTGRPHHSTARQPRLQARPTGICAPAQALGRPALCDGARRRGQHQRPDPRAERAGPGLTRARQGLRPPPHSGRPWPRPPAAYRRPGQLEGSSPQGVCWRRLWLQLLCKRVRPHAPADTRTPGAHLTGRRLHDGR